MAKVPLHWAKRLAEDGRSTDDTSRLTALLVGQLFPIFSLLAPCQPGASPVAKLQEMIGTLRGQAALVESVRNMGDGLPKGAGGGDWKPNRLGANPPLGPVDLSDKAGWPFWVRAVSHRSW